MLIVLTVALNCGVTTGFLMFRWFYNPKDNFFHTKGTDLVISIILGFCVAILSGMLTVGVLALIRLVISNPNYILWVS